MDIRESTRKQFKIGEFCHYNFDSDFRGWGTKWRPFPKMTGNGTS